MILAIVNAAQTASLEVRRMVSECLSEARELAHESGQCVMHWFLYAVQCRTRFDLCSRACSEWFANQGIA